MKKFRRQEKSEIRHINALITMKSSSITLFFVGVCHLVFEFDALPALQIQLVQAALCMFYTQFVCIMLQC